jgi:hypothetical protein
MLLPGMVWRAPEHAPALPPPLPAHVTEIKCMLCTFKTQDIFVLYTEVKMCSAKQVQSE